MTESMIQVEIDPVAALAYVELGHGDVARTVQFTDEVTIDLDPYGMVLGVEFLTLTADLDPDLRARLESQYHVPSQVLDVLPAALAAVANWNRQAASRRVAREQSRRPSYGVLRPTAVLTESSS
ncbi:DUF2283 domain-containing protein [Streptomyces spongiicola]|nr:DUF2283 domain-containing protein [Streptomyces spongiicola]GBQ01507.1 DUF2283 domain-containing protein [Streptomyces spongiicola]